MRKAADKVTGNFLNRQAFCSATMSTDGYTLRSYQMVIARRIRGKVMIIDKSESPSKTTSSHINAVVEACKAANVPFEIVMMLTDGGR